MAAAEPVLASLLYQSEEQDRVQPARPEKRLLTSFKYIDYALADGLVSGDGGICCISSETSAGGKEISDHLLISHLLSGPEASVSIIDTAGTLDLFRIFNLLTWRLQRQASTTSKATLADYEERAKAILARISITRAFDFEGMLDGISELRERLDQARNPPRGTVADSQDEDTDMLLEPESKQSHQPEVPQDKEPKASEWTLLLIDDLTSPLSPILKANYAQGQALLSTLLRSLRHLARAHDLVVLLLNSTITYKYNTGIQALSVFSATPSTPALGRALSQGIDMHLLVTRVPRTAQDARVLFGSSAPAAGPTSLNEAKPPDRTVQSKRKADSVSVVEVLCDRLDNKTGRFGVFDIDAQGMINDGRLGTVPRRFI